MLLRIFDPMWLPKPFVSSAVEAPIGRARRRGISTKLDANGLGFALLLFLGNSENAVAKNKSHADAFAATAPAPRPDPVSNGAIFQGDGYTPLTSGNRAGGIGDIVTIQLVERISASKTNSASTGRNGSIGLTPPATGPLGSLFSSTDINMGGDQSFTRVGSSSGTPVDVRIISATHRDMDHAIADGRFRQDLFFRLGVVLVHVPALAERAEDIPLLVRHFQKGKPSGAIAHFDESALERLMAHDWPGNVRELRNVVERAGVLYGGEILNADDVDLLLTNAAPPFESRREPVAVAPVSFVPASPAPCKDHPIDLRQEIEAIELERINMALELADGIVSEAARLLTLKRTTLIEKMRKYGVQAVA